MLFQYVEHPTPGGLFQLRISERKGRVKLAYYLNEECINKQDFNQNEFPPPLHLPLDSAGQELTVICEDKSERIQKSWIIGDKGSLL